MTLPIRRVRADGGVDDVGVYDRARRVLVLTGPGYPLRQAGEYVVDGDLPWMLQEMAPGGYMGRRFAQSFPELGVPKDPRLWRVEDTLHALTQRGEDLPGNLLIGDESHARLLARAHLTMDLPEVDDLLAGAASSSLLSGRGLSSVLEARVESLVQESLASPRSSSSVGGDRPKFLLPRVILKFSPTKGTPFAERWSDLLSIESHCLATLRAAGIAAASAVVVDGERRRFLAVQRFDRVGVAGRRGAATWFWLDAQLYGTGDAALCAQRLRADGTLTADELDRFQVVHAFSAATGNTDTHLGNYGLVFDDDGGAHLSPFYDVVPMAFAPRHDELPDAYIVSASRSPEPRVHALVGQLAARVEEDPLITAEFKIKWMKYIGHP